jgi:hypothetical protein
MEVRKWGTRLCIISGNEIIQRGKVLLTISGGDIRLRGITIYSCNGTELLQKGQNVLTLAGNDIIRRGQIIFTLSGCELMEGGKSCLVFPERPRWIHLCAVLIALDMIPKDHTTR